MVISKNHEIDAVTRHLRLGLVRRHQRELDGTAVVGGPRAQRVSDGTLDFAGVEALRDARPRESEDYMGRGPGCRLAVAFPVRADVAVRDRGRQHAGKQRADEPRSHESSHPTTHTLWLFGTSTPQSATHWFS